LQGTNINYWRKHKCQIKTKQDPPDKAQQQVEAKADVKIPTRHQQIKTPHFLAHYEDDFVQANRGREKVAVMDGDKDPDSVTKADDGKC